MEKNIEKLNMNFRHSQLINEVLKSEIEELKKINKGLLEAYERVNNDNIALQQYYQIATKYSAYYPIIDKFRKSFIFKIYKKIKNLFRGRK